MDDSLSASALKKISFPVPSNIDMMDSRHSSLRTQGKTHIFHFYKWTNIMLMKLGRYRTL